MERTEILKSLGFSEEFLAHIRESTESLPNAYFILPFSDGKKISNVLDTSDSLTLNCINDNCVSNIIVIQNE